MRFKLLLPTLLAALALGSAGVVMAPTVKGSMLPTPAKHRAVLADTQVPPDAAADTPAPPAGSAAAASAPAPRTVKEILDRAAHQVGVDANLLMAVSFWESGWRQSAVSSEGAIGLLQVMPKTAATAGPVLLGHAVRIDDPLENAIVGAALLKDLVSKYDERTALAAYYQGEPTLFGGRAAPDTWRYADGILQLRAQIAAGHYPADPNQPPS